MKVFGLDATLGELLDHMEHCEEAVSVLRYYAEEGQVGVFLVGCGAEGVPMVEGVAQLLVEMNERAGLRTESIERVALDEEGRVAHPPLN